MAKNEFTDQADKERQTAHKWYHWLWLSPLLTIPTLLILYFAIDSLVYGLTCPQGWQSCTLNYQGRFLLSAIIAVLGSALWHLVLLIPARNKESAFVRWHGRQELLLAGLRTAVPLLFVVTFRQDYLTLASVLIVIPIWLFGTWLGQRQAARGDCSLMRWTGRSDALPVSPEEPTRDLGIERSPDELLDIVRFSDDPELRDTALAELKRIGLVEDFGEDPFPEQTSTSMQDTTKKKSTKGWIIGTVSIVGLLGLTLFIWGANQFQQTIKPEPTKISLTATDIYDSLTAADKYTIDGDIHAKKGEFTEAVEDYRKAIALDPEHTFALNNLAWTLAYHLDSNYEEALDYAILSVELDPDAANHDTLAFIYFKLERIDSALMHYDTALALDPNSGPSYLGRGDVHLAMGDYESAVVDYEKYLALNPDASDRKEVEDKIDSLRDEY